jgi:hypothetical protein
MRLKLDSWMLPNKRRAGTPHEQEHQQTVACIGPPRCRKAKSLHIHLSIQIAGEAGMDDFARMLRVLYDHGYQGQVNRLVQMLVSAAKEHGALIPPELERFFEDT